LRRHGCTSKRKEFGSGRRNALFRQTRALGQQPQDSKRRAASKKFSAFSGGIKSAGFAARPVHPFLPGRESPQSFQHPFGSLYASLIDASYSPMAHRSASAFGAESGAGDAQVRRIPGGWRWPSP